ncbi:dienelactone hydrolase family protein [Candidatus Leptofilum sp.]|uniref:dienelactone hydrolase family protein n=1 Tax=Candidatus Leptofilum sp. TaxID=3241576 RepID=UPI003B5AA6D6
MKIEAKNVEANAYLALPNEQPAPGVLVLHPWWGLNKDIEGVCDRLAEAGFVAMAPDLYDGCIATTINEAEKYSEAMNEDIAKAVVKAALNELLAHEACRGGKVGVIGFSLGASFAVQITHDQSERVASVVLFYGLGWAEQTKTQASYLGHFAENDPYEDDAYREHFEQKLKDNGRPVTFHIYPGTGHWFFERSRPDAYDKAAAELAWERTLSFLSQTLR